MNIKESDFRKAYLKYFKVLCLISYRSLNDMEKAKDVVQQVFFDLYENSNSRKIEGELYPYLKKAVYYKSIDLIKKEQSKKKYIETLNTEKEISQMENLFDLAELEKTIYETISTLPKQCQVIFLKSRKESKSNKEIAEELNISIRTVENQIYKALKKLKAVLKNHFMQLLFTFL